MKALILGMAGLSAVGGAAYVAGGKKPVDDFVGIVNKSPQEVYAALSAAGPDGVAELPVPAMPGAPRMSRRITKEADKSVRLEVLMDDRTFASVEFEIAPADGGKTQLAGEVDFDMSVINDAIRERGGQPLPGLSGGVAEGYIDRAFATAMAQAVHQINDGQLSLAVLTQGSSGFTTPDWGRGGGPSFGGNGGMAIKPTWSTQGSTRATVSARPSASLEPAVDPNAAVHDHLREQQRVQGAGW